MLSVGEGGSPETEFQSRMHANIFGEPPDSITIMPQLQARLNYRIDNCTNYLNLCCPFVLCVLITNKEADEANYPYINTS